MSTGYAHADYAAALREFGRPRTLPESGGTVLERDIANAPHTDLMGCYPIFSCDRWEGLAADLDALATDPDDTTPVCVSMVADPFMDLEVPALEHCFPDLCRPFKQHFVVDLAGDPTEFVGSHHRRNARKALRNLDVEIVDNPVDEIETWHELYGNLIERHGITGMSAFSRESFASQLTTPGMTMFRAREGEETVGMVLWYSQEDRAYYHLAAYTERGYEQKTSFAIFWTAIEHFRGKLRWLSLGASAGLDGEATDGLSRFKKGWSTGTKTAYLCGRILNRPIYDQLTTRNQAEGSPYFPAYRAGEFG